MTYTVILSRQDVRGIIWAINTGLRALYHEMDACMDEARNERLGKHVDALAELGDRLEDLLD